MNYFMTIERASMITIEPLCVSDPTDEINLWVKSPKRDIKEGDTVELECQGNGNPQPSSFTFRHEGVHSPVMSCFVSAPNYVDRLSVFVDTF